MIAPVLGPSLEAIVDLAAQRKMDRGLILEQMRKVRDIYNGDIIIPLPELDRNEDPAVPNMIAMGLDQTAMRIASTTPNVFYPPVRPNIQRSMTLADQRRKANLAWWQANKMGLKLRRRARWLAGYSCAPVLLVPDGKWGIARWLLRDPLNTFPAETDDPDEITPPDCIFVFQRKLGWLKRQYPEPMRLLSKGNATDSDLFDLIEYVDDEVRVLAVVGRPAAQYSEPIPGDGRLMQVELLRVPNRARMPLAVVPGRITLDRLRGQFDGMVGMYKTQAKITALELIAVEKGIFPNRYLVARPNETPEFVVGPFDGRTGKVNIVKGGEPYQEQMNPNFAATGMNDRIERAAAITSGVPSQFGGEVPTNVRTGRANDVVMSATVDQRVQEAQEILAASLEAENRVAVAIAKTYFGHQRRSFYVSTHKVNDHAVYVPNQIFETDNNVVSYPMAGADVNGLVIGIGQRIGLGTMSKRTGQEIDPYIDDPQEEYQRVTKEQLEAALLATVQSQAEQGVIPPADVARIIQLVFVNGKTIADAVTQAQQEAQQRQATVAQPGTPEAQPGLAQPGQGAEQPTQIAGPNGSQQNLAQLLGVMHKVQGAAA